MAVPSHSSTNAAHSAKNMPALKAKVLSFQQLINTCQAELCEIVHKRAIAGQNRLNLDKTLDPTERGQGWSDGAYLGIAS